MQSQTFKGTSEPLDPREKIRQKILGRLRAKKAARTRQRVSERKDRFLKKTKSIRDSLSSRQEGLSESVLGSKKSKKTSKDLGETFRNTQNIKFQTKTRVLSKSKSLVVRKSKLSSKAGLRRLQKPASKLSNKQSSLLSDKSKSVQVSAGKVSSKASSALAQTSISSLAAGRGNLSRSKSKVTGLLRDKSGFKSSQRSGLGSDITTVSTGKTTTTTQDFTTSEPSPIPPPGEPTGRTPPPIIPVPKPPKPRPPQSPPPRTPQIRKPRIPSFGAIKGDVPTIKKLKSKVSKPSYTVDVRKEGKFVPVAKGLSKKAANKYGKYYIDTTVRASYRARRTGDKVSFKISGLPSLPKSKFRRSKQFSDVVVERRSNRIDSVGEKSGLKSARVKGSFGLFGRGGGFL